MPNTTKKDISLIRESILKETARLPKEQKNKIDTIGQSQIISQQQNIIGSYYQNNIAPAQLQTIATREIINDETEQDVTEEQNKQIEEGIPNIEELNKELNKEEPTIQEKPIKFTGEEGEQILAKQARLNEISGQKELNISEGIKPEDLKNYPVETVEPQTTEQQNQTNTIPQTNTTSEIETEISNKESQKTQEQEKVETEQVSQNIETRNLPQTPTQQISSQSTEAQIGNENQQQSNTLVNILTQLDSKIEAFLQSYQEDKRQMMQLMIGYTKYLDNIQKSIENINLLVDEPEDTGQIT